MPLYFFSRLLNSPSVHFSYSKISYFKRSSLNLSVFYLMESMLLMRMTDRGREFFSLLRYCFEYS
jgi:hypothetical protein